jgi:signal transduction histidine kinase
MRRLWASRVPEAAWTAFAAGNLVWMVLAPSQSLLPFHFIWISLLLLYGLGYRTYTRRLTWFLLVPVMAGAALLFIDARIRALQPYDELIELPVMVVMLFAITRHTSRRAAAMAALDEVSRHNTLLLERQRAFVQNASHELRTPITVALAHAELLPKAASATAGVDGGASAEIAEDAAIITDELVRLRGLVDRLLLLATAEQADLLRTTPVQLAPLAGDLLRRWEPIPRRWLAGRIDDATVLADEDRLTLALDAIVDNAVRFTGDGDQIEISVACDDGAAAITITDTGPGIPDEQLGWVFDKFARADTSRRTTPNFGLGLPIVRATAEAHGGQVTAGRSPSGGTAVTFTLPLCKSGALRPAGGGTGGMAGGLAHGGLLDDDRFGGPQFAAGAGGAEGEDRGDQQENGGGDQRLVEARIEGGRGSGGVGGEQVGGAGGRDGGEDGQAERAADPL